MPRPRKSASPFRYFNSSPEVNPPGGVDVRPLPVVLAERGRLAVRARHKHFACDGSALVNRFGPLFAAHIRRQRVNRMRSFRHWRWYLDEMYVRLNGEMAYLWRAVDHEGEIFENLTRTRDMSAALRFKKKALKRHGSPETITTDGLRSYRAAMGDFGNADKQEVGVEPTTGWRTRTCHSDDESAQCSGSGR